MPLEPRIRVSAVLRWQDRILLCRHEKAGRGEYWLLPGGGVNSGESLTDALHRELREEVGIEDEIPVEGPVAIVDSISPQRAFAAKHVVHIIFAGDLSGRSLEAVTSQDAAVRGHRLFERAELDDVVAPSADPALPAALGAGRPGRVSRRRCGHHETLSAAAEANLHPRAIGPRASSSSSRGRCARSSARHRAASRRC